MIAIEIKPVGMKEAARKLKGIKGGLRKAVSKSINAALMAGRTESSQLIRKQYNIKAARIKEDFTMDKSGPARLEGALVAKGPMLPLAAFNPRVKLEKAGKMQRSHQHVYAVITKGKSKLIKGAFKVPSGNFMERRQPEREPIFPVSVIGVPIMVAAKKIQPQVEERMVKAYETAFKYNVEFYLKKKR